MWKDTPMTEKEIQAKYGKKAKPEKVEKCDRCGSTDFSVKHKTKTCNKCSFKWR
jgi:ribosomal protein L37E